MKKSGWLKLKDAPLSQDGYVWCAQKSWGNRTDMVGRVIEYESGERFVAGNFHGYDITHWHPLLKPPVE